MSETSGEFLLAAIEKTLRFRFYDGGLRREQSAARSRWRTLPYTIVAGVSSGRVRLDRHDSTSCELGPAEAFVLPEGVRHVIGCAGTRPAEYRYATVRYRVLDTFDFLSFLRIPARFRGARGREISRICARLSRPNPARGAFGLGGLAQRLELGHRLLTLIVGGSSPRHDAFERMHYLERIAPVLGYIRNHLAEPMTRATLARMVNLSPPRFHVVFKKIMRVPPMVYVKRVRLREAQARLLTTEDPVAAVGKSAGYGDQFHFSRQFKAVYGVSPLHYRRLARSV